MFNVGSRVTLRHGQDAIGIVLEIDNSRYGDYVMYLIEWDYGPAQWHKVTELLRYQYDYNTPPKTTKEEGQSMSQAIWCDQGGHAFSSKDPGKRHFSETRTVDDGHRVSQVTAEMDICGPCSESSFLAQTPALTATQDQVTTKGV